jgi:hypothetical protein
VTLFFLLFLFDRCFLCKPFCSFFTHSSDNFQNGEVQAKSQTELAASASIPPNSLNSKANATVNTLTPVWSTTSSIQVSSVAPLSVTAVHSQDLQSSIPRATSAPSFLSAESELAAHKAAEEVAAAETEARKLAEAEAEAEAEAVKASEAVEAARVAEVLKATEMLKAAEVLKASIEAAEAAKAAAQAEAELGKGMHDLGLDVTEFKCQVMREIQAQREQLAEQLRELTAHLYAYDGDEFMVDIAKSVCQLKEKRAFIEHEPMLLKGIESRWSNFEPLQLSKVRHDPVLLPHLNKFVARSKELVLVAVKECEAAAHQKVPSVDEINALASKVEQLFQEQLARMRVSLLEEGDSRATAMVSDFTEAIQTITAEAESRPTVMQAQILEKEKEAEDRVELEITEPATVAWCEFVEEMNTIVEAMLEPEDIGALSQHLQSEEEILMKALKQFHAKCMKPFPSHPRSDEDDEYEEKSHDNLEDDDDSNDHHGDGDGDGGGARWGSGKSMGASQRIQEIIESESDDDNAQTKVPDLSFDLSLLTAVNRDDFPAILRRGGLEGETIVIPASEENTLMFFAVARLSDSRFVLGYSFTKNHVLQKRVRQFFFIFYFSFMTWFV